MRRYQYLYEEDGSAICVDVNECTAGNHMCSPDAQCINQEGGHTCQCRTGFTGDGRDCESKCAVYVYFIINYGTHKQECYHTVVTFHKVSTKLLLLIVTKIILTSCNILEEIHDT